LKSGKIVSIYSLFFLQPHSEMVLDSVNLEMVLEVLM